MGRTSGGDRAGRRNNFAANIGSLCARRRYSCSSVSLYLLSRFPVGKHHAHTQRKSVQEMHDRAIAKRQPLPWQQIGLVSVSFMSFCTLLYLYLNYLAEDDDDLEESE